MKRWRLFGVLMGTIVVALGARHSQAAPCMDGEDFRTCDFAASQIQACGLGKLTVLQQKLGYRQGQMLTCHQQPQKAGFCRLERRNGKNLVFYRVTPKGRTPIRALPCQEIQLMPATTNQCQFQFNSCPFLAEGAPVSVKDIKNAAGAVRRKVVNFSRSGRSDQDIDDVLKLDADDPDGDVLATRLVQFLPPGANSYQNIEMTFEKLANAASLPDPLKQFKADAGETAVIVVQDVGTAPSGTDPTRYARGVCRRKLREWRNFCTLKQATLTYKKNTTGVWIAIEESLKEVVTPPSTTRVRLVVRDENGDKVIQAGEKVFKTRIRQDIRLKTIVQAVEDPVEMFEIQE